MKTLFFSSVIMALFICSCATETETELTDEQKATIISEVEDQLNANISALNEVDIDAWLENQSEEDFISSISGIYYFDNYSTWVDSAKYWWSFVESRQMEVTKMHVTPLDPNLALAAWSYNSMSISKSGEQTKGTGVVSLLWKKEPTGWKIIHGHSSGQPITEE